MGLLIILLIIEILTIIVIRQHFFDRSWMRYYLFLTINTILSVWLWVLCFKAVNYEGFFEETDHVWLLMSLNGMIGALVIPRIILSSFHFSGVYTQRHSGGHNRKLTNIGLILASAIFVILLGSNFYGRFDFKKENITVKIKDLKKDLVGLKIVHISDLHLSSFYHHDKRLTKVMKEIKEIDPDILINTGDFVTIGWREFSNFDTILRIAKGKYANLAIMGNHDFGTYNPYYSEADLENNVLLMNRLIASSGYKVLNDESVMVNVGSSKISFSGVITKGAFPKIIWGDLQKALAGTDSADLKILLSHDPNHWEKEVVGKTDIDLTLSGHTHGMQIGVFTKKFAWSPVSFFYPRWNGLYQEGDQFLIVSRGLGVLGFPFRICMPPDILVITLTDN